MKDYIPDSVKQIIAMQKYQPENHTHLQFARANAWPKIAKEHILPPSA